MRSGILTAAGFLCIWVCAAGSPAYASWAQINDATDDEAVQEETTKGSVAFLTAAQQVQAAMVKLDEEKFEQAALLGLDASKIFGKAHAHFKKASDRIRAIDGIEEELRKYLAEVNFVEKAHELGIRPEKSPLWQHTQDVVLSKGAAELFREAADRAELQKKVSEAVFTDVKEGKYRPRKGAALLLQLGVDLAFGAYVSVIFIKE